MEMLSDGGSTPPASTRWTLDEHLLFQRRLCRDGVALMSKKKATQRQLALGSFLFCYPIICTLKLYPNALRYTS